MMCNFCYTAILGMFRSSNFSCFVPGYCSVLIMKEIAKLEKEIEAKDQLLENSIEMVRKAESSFRKLKQRQLRNVYKL